MTQTTRYGKTLPGGTADEQAVLAGAAGRGRIPVSEATDGGDRADGVRRVGAGSARQPA